MDKEFKEKLGVVRKAFVSNNITERLLREIMEIRGNGSRSQVIRDAIFEYRKSTKGLYLEESPTMGIKRKAISEQEAFEKMSDEEYARSLGAIFAKTGDNEDVAIIHWFFDSVKALPIKGFKELPKDVIENHKTIQAENPIQKAVLEPGNSNSLRSNYDIIIADVLSNKSTNPTDS